MTPYPLGSVEMMRKFYQTLNEKDKRRYAATEAIKLGHGGICYIAEILQCARSTIHIGIRELQAVRGVRHAISAPCQRITSLTLVFVNREVDANHMPAVIN